MTRFKPITAAHFGQRYNNLTLCLLDCSKLELQKQVDRFCSENEALQLQVDIIHDKYIFMLPVVLIAGNVRHLKTHIFVTVLNVFDIHCSIMLILHVGSFCSCSCALCFCLSILMTDLSIFITDVPAEKVRQTVLISDLLIYCDVTADKRGNETA